MISPRWKSTSVKTPHHEAKGVDTERKRPGFHCKWGTEGNSPLKLTFPRLTDNKDGDHVTEMDNRDFRLILSVQDEIFWFQVKMNDIP